MHFGFKASIRAQVLFAALAGLVVTWGAGEARSATLAHPPGGAPGHSSLRAFDQPPPLSHDDPGDMLFGRPPADTRAPTMPRLARFRADTGDTFVFEITGSGPAYLKYDDSGEVWVLNPTTGPRGDTIYKNDVGQAMLRATRLGGLTVFTQDQPAGVAAALEGSATDLHNMISGPIAILRVLVQASARTSQAAGHRVEFEAGCPARSHDRTTCPADELGFAGRPSSQRISEALFRR
jgi:hypothetical protein